MTSCFVNKSRLSSPQSQFQHLVARSGRQAIPSGRKSGRQIALMANVCLLIICFIAALPYVWANPSRSPEEPEKLGHWYCSIYCYTRCSINCSKYCFKPSLVLHLCVPVCVWKWKILLPSVLRVPARSDILKDWNISQPHVGALHY